MATDRSPEEISRVIHRHDEASNDEVRVIHAEIVLRMEQYFACWNHLSRMTPPESSEHAYQVAFRAILDRYSVPDTLWGIAWSNGPIPRNWMECALKHVSTWIQGRVDFSHAHSDGEFYDVLDEQWDTDMIYFFYGIPHGEVTFEDKQRLYTHLEQFGSRHGLLH